MERPVRIGTCRTKRYAGNSEMRKATGRLKNYSGDDANQRWRIIENSDLYHQKEFYRWSCSDLSAGFMNLQKRRKSKRYYISSLRKGFSGGSRIKKEIAFCGNDRNGCCADGDINNLLENDKKL